MNCLKNRMWQKSFDMIQQNLRNATEKYLNKNTFFSNWKMLHSPFHPIIWFIGWYFRYDFFISSWGWKIVSHCNQDCNPFHSHSNSYRPLTDWANKQKNLIYSGRVSNFVVWLCNEKLEIGWFFWVCSKFLIWVSLKIVWIFIAMNKHIRKKLEHFCKHFDTIFYWISCNIFYILYDRISLVFKL